MPGAPMPLARMGVDICSGHPGPGFFPPRPAITGSLTVFADTLPVVRLSDVWAVHSNIVSAHPGVGLVGSATVFCEGIPVMRMGDPLNCGSVIALGSLTVFCG